MINKSLVRALAISGMIAFASVILSPSDAMAFSKERCGRMFPQSDNDHPYFYSPIYVTTMMPSTTSYFSSIGPCSMYGEYQASNRVSFIEEALPSIRSEAARGEGEYLRALAQVSGCPVDRYATVASIMRRDFATVFVGSNAASSDIGSQIERIDAALRSDTSLQKTCAALN